MLDNISMRQGEEMNIDLGPIQIDPRQYGIQGNAVLGIKETGKSYFATMMGERLMEAGIPIIALDPIGIWRFLRVAGTGAGFPVVVAGGEHGDLPLNPEATKEIVRAAMRDGVSLVLDLYDLNLSKTDWKRVVRDAVRTLLYENKGRGVRHVFIEEAAEFVPQVVGRGDVDGQVYAEVEKMARMGGNAQLGFTLISPRAAEVNKSVLELCDALFLFRQRGKNAIEGLGKWFDVAGVEGAKEIRSSLSALGQGECWAWIGDRPIHIKRTPAKRTYHPDRRAGAEPASVVTQRTVDVSAFVAHMRGSLDKIVAEAKPNDPAELKKTIADLRRQLASNEGEKIIAADPAALDAEYQRGHADGFEEGRQEGYRDGLRALEPLAPVVADLSTHLKEASQFTADLERLMTAPMDEPAARAPVAAPPRPRPAPPSVTIKEVDTRHASPPRQADGSLPGPQQRILDAVRWWESVGVSEPIRVRVAAVANYSPNGSAFTNPLGALRSAGHVNYPRDGSVSLTQSGRALSHRPTATPTTADLHAKINAILDGPRQRILAPLLRSYPRAMTRDQLASAASYSPDGSAFTNPLGALRALGLIDYPESGKVVALPILFVGDRR